MTNSYLLQQDQLQCLPNNMSPSPPKYTKRIAGDTKHLTPRTQESLASGDMDVLFRFAIP